MQLLGVFPGTESIRPNLLGTQFDGWHRFPRVPADSLPVHPRALGERSLHRNHRSPLPTLSFSMVTSPATDAVGPLRDPAVSSISHR